MSKTYDFSGWATRANMRCSDGRVIMKDAFKENNGKRVPLVWNHDHDGPDKVLGHADLENRNEGVYAYCSFNDTDSGKTARVIVEHGDVNRLSIFANQLQQQGDNVYYGNIRELSLVLAGKNPGAFIDSVVRHGIESEEEAIICTGDNIVLAHSDDGSGSADNETIEDVFNTLTDKQKNVVYAMVGAALENSDDGEDDNKEEDKEVKHNLFDNDDMDNENVISHADMEAIITDAKRYGSMKESALAHGIEQIDYLFPEAKTLNNPPDWIKRDMDWVPKVINGVHHTPFSRIKSMFADITEDDARAKGYIKGNLKKEQVFGLLKRTTTPTTIYKKQKLDRDDVIDITDFDVIAWLKGEMRFMLDEEIARAILVGDGRAASSDDKINEQNIRPIWKDDDLYTIKAEINTGNAKTANARIKAFIRSAIKARKNYKGSGTPTLFTTEDVLTDCLLIEDNNGRIIYDSVDKLATTLRVREIIAVPVLEGLSRTASDGKTMNLMGIIVNLQDYNVGADKGGAVNMFDDFDIDYNAQKYLIETRCSGALIKPFSAIALEIDAASAAANATLDDSISDSEIDGMFDKD